MADKVIVSKTKLTALGNAIREKTSQSQNLTLDEMATSVANISEGIDTTDATATSSDILLGKTAYVNDIKVKGIIETYDGSNTGGVVEKDMLQARVDATNSCDYLFYKYNGRSLYFIKKLDLSNCDSAQSMFENCINITTIPTLDTSTIEYMQYMFCNCQKLQTIPQLNVSNAVSTAYMFEDCKALTEMPSLDIGKVTHTSYMFNNCTKLFTVGELNLNSVTMTAYMFKNCTNLTNLTLKNIKVNLQIGNGTTWGHLLTLDSLINTIKELVNVGASRTLTMGSANLEKIANVYVRLTGEAEEVEGLTKVPCEVCKSTDEGAMLITAYANSKNWTLA